MHTFVTVGDEAFFGKFSWFWAGDLPLPSCSHGYASVECVPRLCLDTTPSLHLFSAWFCERWVSKSVCPWSDVFFTSGSETDFISIFCHTVGTDEECDHCLSLFGRAMLPFVFSFTAFFKNIITLLHVTTSWRRAVTILFFLFSKFLIFTAHFCDCWRWGLLREIFLFLSRRFATTILQSWLRICGMRS